MRTAFPRTFLTALLLVVSSVIAATPTVPADRELIVVAVDVIERQRFPINREQAVARLDDYLWTAYGAKPPTVLTIADKTLARGVRAVAVLMYNGHPPTAAALATEVALLANEQKQTRLAGWLADLSGVLTGEGELGEPVKPATVSAARAQAQRFDAATLGMTPQAKTGLIWQRMDDEISRAIGRALFERHATAKDRAIAAKIDRAPAR